ncbi:PDZ domain-containing protein [Coprothermobacteraceae bacterium]|nr:PDZ domain-containing protein [Coprothermobacteraceae bacterium]
MKKLRLISILLVFIVLLGAVPAFSYSQRVLELYPNRKAAVLDGKTYILTATPVIFNDRLYVPVRDIGNLMGAEVYWDSVQKKAVFRYPDLNSLVSENQTLRSELTEALGKLQQQEDPQIRVLLDTIKLVRDQYLFPEKTAGVVYGAAKGAVQSLQDPYSDFYDPQEAEQLMRAIQGSYVGIGVYLQDSSSGVVVVKVVPGSPAEQAGIKAGDIITKVDGTSVIGWSVDQVSALIKGEEGTLVSVTVNRAGTEISFSMYRKKISVPTVSLVVNTSTVVVIQLDQFGENTAQEFKTALASVKAPKLVIDLRGNPGGLVTSLLEVAGALQGPKPVFVYRDNQQTSVVNATGKQVYYGRVFVLVDKYSASAAEMLAGALKDNRVATVVGERTFGKGVGQSLFELEDGSVLYLTTFEFRTPKGNVIDRFGIEPDISINPSTALDYVLSLP